MVTQDRAATLRLYRILAWLWVAAGIALQVLAILMLSSLQRDLLLENWQSLQGRAISTLPTLMLALSGGLIASRLPHNRYGWVLIAVGFTSSCQAFGGALSFYAYVHQWPVEVVALGNHIDAIGWVLGIALISFALLLFPTGDYLTARWRWIGRALIIATAAGIAVVWVLPGPMTFGPPLDNPFGLTFISARIGELMIWAPTLVLFLGIVGGVLSLVLRFRRAGGVERQQIKWVAYGAVLFLAIMASDTIRELPGLWDILKESLAMSLLPITIAVSILRYRLYDIDVVIRKTLVYTVLTVLLALVYFGIVVLLQALFGRLAGVEQSTLAVVVSTLAIAALFTPLRRHIQDWIDRRFYRKKYDAQQVLAQFAQTARDETDLDALLAELVRVVDETLQPEHVSVWLRPERAKEPLKEITLRRSKT